MRLLPENYDIYRLSGSELQNYFTITVLVIFCTGYVFYRSVPAALVMCLLSVAGLPHYRSMLADRRKNMLRLQFKDMLYSVSSSVTAGRYLPEAIEESYDAVSLIHGSDSILAIEIKNMVRQMKEANSSDETVLRSLAERSCIREITDFSDACSTCRRTGGDLNRMIQKEKEVLMAQKKLESRLLAGMPVAVTGLINLSSSDYLDVMYDTALGRILMTAAFAGTVFSFLYSMKMTYTEGQVNI